MKTILALFATSLLFVGMLFFYIFLYDMFVQAFGGIVTFLIIIGILYLYVKLISVIDASKRMR
jgi:hypothetical protein